MPNKHALLSASSAARWIACPPSARLCEALPDEPTPYALEGTDAHTLAAFKILAALGRPVKDPTESLRFFSQEMASCTDAYRDFVLDGFRDAGKRCETPALLVEQRVDYSAWVPGGFGTGDAIIAGDGLLQVIDFKYGRGVLVDAEWNPQLLCYGLGALALFGDRYDIRTLRLSVFQPRRDHLSTFELDRQTLLKWAEETLAPAAKLAWAGEGEFRAGEHCRFCRLKATCRTRAEHSLALAREAFRDPPELSPEEIGELLPRIDGFIRWARTLRDYAVKQALGGVKYPGLKLVEGRTLTRFTDEAAVAAAVRKAGYNPYERKLLSVTAMRELLGNRQFITLLGRMTGRTRGAPILVPENDKRPEYAPADHFFKEEEES